MTFHCVGHTVSIVCEVLDDTLALHEIPKHCLKAQQISGTGTTYYYLDSVHIYLQNQLVLLFPLPGLLHQDYVVYT